VRKGMRRRRRRRRRRKGEQWLFVPPSCLW